ncbi:MAG: riboflavin synthase [Treponema sp.]|nr:riboflavin synthase [Candidatus Treponema equifaecale]
MFTGIVEGLGCVESISHGTSSLALAIKCDFAKELVLGESVAVNGTCLTVTSMTETSFTADVTPESFRRTSLGELGSGSFVNLERAMKADGRFGGHIVSGHVDGTGKILSAQKEENAVNVFVSVPSSLGKYIIEKGSVCVDGISLTVASVAANGGNTTFSVAVIPHTWENTTLSKKQNGATVNIECDVVGKYIEHFLNYPKPSVNEEDSEAIQAMMSSFTSFH